MLHRNSTDRALAAFALAVLLSFGCATSSRRAGGSRCWPLDPIQHVKGDGRKFTPFELMQIARDHAQREGVTAVDFASRTPNIYVIEFKRPSMAIVHWPGNLGEPFLSVEIGRDGKVVQHEVAVGKCEFIATIAEVNSARNRKLR